MNPTAFQTPWSLLAQTSGFEPIVCWTDLAPDAPHPGVFIGNATGQRLLGKSTDLEQLRATATESKDQIVCLPYELGALIEPRAGSGQVHHGPPCAAGVVIDVEDSTCFEACGTSARWGHNPTPISSNTGFSIELVGVNRQRCTYIAGVKRILEYIRAGDVYQVNLTHRISGFVRGSRRAFAAALLDSTNPWHGAYFEFVGHDARRRAIVSASPELFLDFDPESRIVRTRPMKGTRPADADQTELFAAEKDRAELNMIVDLMRNDLGRVCEFGTVRVDEPRTIEQHSSSVLQATATVSGRLRSGLDLPDLIQACFAPGSVTGTPKIRAMQIIDELESHRRGVYCGSIGTIRSNGRVRLNVAIRTAILTETDQPGLWQLDYPVGAGIVADSDPEAEWQETLDKAEILTRLTHASGLKPEPMA